MVKIISTVTAYILCSQRWRSSIQSAKTRPGADCGSNHELLIAKFRLKLQKVGKTTRPFRYDLNQISYDYTVEVTRTASWESWAWGDMRKGGSTLVTLIFDGGALFCITYGPSQSLYSTVGYLLGEHLGASLMSGNRTRQQWLHSTSSLLLGSVPSTHLGFHSCRHLSS